MMSRYRQELAKHPPVEALRISIVRTGGVISSAGLILAGTFAVLMTQPIRELYQFGLAMAIGILLDTFVVRPLHPSLHPPPRSARFVAEQARAQLNDTPIPSQETPC